MNYERFKHIVQLILSSDIDDGARGEFRELGLVLHTEETYLDFNGAEWATPSNEYPEFQPRCWYYITDREGFFEALRERHPDHTLRFLLEQET